MKKIEINILDDKEINKSSVLKDIDLSGLSIKFDSKSKYIIINGEQKDLLSLAKLLITISENKLDNDFSIHLDPLTPNTFGHLSKDSSFVIIEKENKN